MFMILSLTPLVHTYTRAQHTHRPLNFPFYFFFIFYFFIFKGSTLRSFQERMLRLFGYSIPLFHGRGIFNYNFGLLPFRRPITVVTGEPIEVLFDYFKCCFFNFLFCFVLFCILIFFFFKLGPQESKPYKRRN